MSKFLEYVILGQLTDYLIKKNILCSDQFGFRSGYTTELAALGSPKCAAITGVGVDTSPHCFIKCPNGSASYTASGSKV